VYTAPAALVETAQ